MYTQWSSFPLSTNPNTLILLPSTMLSLTTFYMNLSYNDENKKYSIVLHTDSTYYPRYYKIMPQWQ